ncbi:MAG: trypsin-like peptidase domain-containing protein [Pirellulaceae bacterium]
MVALETMVLVCALGAGGDTVLLDFTAAWCGPCQQMKPTVHRLAADGYPVREVDIDRHAQLARQYGVSSVPCFILVSGGREVARSIGGQSYDHLVRMFTAAGYQPAAQSAEATSPTVRAQSPDRLGDRLRQRVGQLFSPPANLPAVAPINTPPAAPTQRPDAQSLPAVQAPGFSAPADQTSYPPQQASTIRDDFAMRESPRSFETAVGHASAAKAAASSYSPRERALRASVRLTVESPSGNDIGSGTIIDVHGDEALVVTCGHIFRESAGKGPITVEFCGLPGVAAVPGKVISYDASRRDIALVAIRPAAALEPMRVAPPGFQIAERQPVFSVGCDHGGPARVMDSQVSGIDRYVGPPNIEVKGQPAQGRSGGGLFSAEGLLIGICNNADPADDEGIYAALSTVHEQLDQAGLRQLFAAVETTTHETPPQSAILVGQSTEFAPNAYAELPMNAAGHSGTEVIFIVRPQDGHGGRSEAITIRNPSPQLLELMHREAHSAAAPQANGDYARPIIRGQSTP